MNRHQRINLNEQVKFTGQAINACPLFKQGLTFVAILLNKQGFLEVKSMILSTINDVKFNKV